MSISSVAPGKKHEQLHSRGEVRRFSGLSLFSYTILRFSGLCKSPAESPATLVSKWPHRIIHWDETLFFCDKGELCIILTARKGNTQSISEWRLAVARLPWATLCEGGVDKWKLKDWWESRAIQHGDCSSNSWVGVCKKLLRVPWSENKMLWKGELCSHHHTGLSNAESFE